MCIRDRVYLFVFGAGVSYMLRLIRMGPTPAPGHAPLSGGPGEPRQPSRPLSAASTSADVPSASRNIKGA